MPPPPIKEPATHSATSPENSQGRNIWNKAREQTGKLQSALAPELRFPFPEQEGVITPQTDPKPRPSRRQAMQNMLFTSQTAEAPALGQLCPLVVSLPTNHYVPQAGSQYQTLSSVGLASRKAWNLFSHVLVNVMLLFC